MKADFISSCRLSRRNHARPRTASQRSTCRYMICKWLSGKESACSAGDPGAVGSTSGSGRFPWRRAQQPTPVSLPGESHGQRSLAGYSPRGRTESDTTEVTDTHTVCGHPSERYTNSSSPKSSNPASTESTSFVHSCPCEAGPRVLLQHCVQQPFVR